ncbi:MAG: M23 family metallopeptidase [Erythrobacter sp.]
MIFAFRGALKLVATTACAVLVTAAAPAMANTNSATSTTTAAAADVVQPLRDSGELPDIGDTRFKSLFTTILETERKAPTIGAVEAPPAFSSPIPQRGISVPSRMPVEGAALTSGFGMRAHPVLGGMRKHTGIDLAAPTGTPVYATADGIVSRADWFGGYGLYISVEHGASMQTRFGHLSRLAVAAGDSVKKGDLIGYVGSTGRSTGPHLHYEVRVEGIAVNPIPYMVESEAQLAYARDARLTGTGGN